MSRLAGWTAKLEPLGGKYYGSHITLQGPDEHDRDLIEVWVSGDHDPSERELEGWDEDEYGPYEICDSHYETAFGYEVCKIIVDAINRVSGGQAKDQGGSSDPEAPQK